MDRKTRHEQFVTGFAGGSIWEVYGVTLTCLLGIITYYFVSKVVTTGYTAFLADFLFNWGTILAAATIYSNKLPLLAVTLSITALTAYYVAPKQHASVNSPSPPKTKRRGDAAKSRAQDGRSSKSSAPAAAHRPFLTMYRSAMMILTITCILAVDFKVFPRRFAKTETWGTSLMDLGVGSFVFSMGIISVRRRLKHPNIPFGTELKDSLIQTSKVIALGLIRLASVKALDYQEHVSEYGAHWNFFFTLGLLPFAFTLLNRVPFLGTLGKAVVLSLGFELTLKNTGLQEWVLAAPRTSLISQNKEGLISFVGYLAIFEFGYSLGLTLLSPSVSLKTIVVKCVKYSVTAQILFSILTIATEPSRRIANLPYIVWVVAFNAGFIAILAALELYVGLVPSLSYISVNTYGESVFILANVATGIINLSIDTISQNDINSIGVLLCYLFFVVSATNFLYSLKK